MPSLISQLITDFARSEGLKVSARGHLKCYYKPARKARRAWTAKKAGQAVCYAIRDGATAAEVRAAFADCLQCTEDRRRAQQQVQAAAQLAASDGVFVAADGVLAGLELIVRLTNRVARFVPQARPASLLLTPIEARIGVVRSQIRAQRAANDAALAALRRAA